MRPLRKAVAPAAILALGATGVALAHVPHGAAAQRPHVSPYTRIAGGTTTLALSSAASSALQSAGLTAAPIAPATATGSTFTFPISGGRINTTNLHGQVDHRGGFTVKHGTTTVAVRSLTILANGKTAELYGAIRHGAATRCRTTGGPRHRHVQCRTVVRWTAVRLAHITGVTVSGSSATGTAALSAASAKLLDRLAGTSAFKAKQVIGTVTVTPTFVSTTTSTTTSSTTTSSSSSTTSV